jgi:hypothetical protein
MVWGMTRTARLRTAALAALFVLGLLLTGQVGGSSLRLSDALAPTWDNKTIAAIGDAALPVPARTRPLTSGNGSPTDKPHSATLAVGPSVLGGLLILPLLFPPGRRALGVAQPPSNPSRAPPLAF